MDVFLQKRLQLLPVLGVTEFNKLRSNKTKKEGLLFCKIKSLIATGKRTNGGFTVYSGSQAVREQLIEKDILIPGKDYLLLSKDVEFSSPSTAASVVVNGRDKTYQLWSFENIPL